MSLASTGQNREIRFETHRILETAVTAVSFRLCYGFEPYHTKWSRFGADARQLRRTRNGGNRPEADIPSNVCALQEQCVIRTFGFHRAPADRRSPDQAPETLNRNDTGRIVSQKQVGDCKCGRVILSLEITGIPPLSGRETMNIGRTQLPPCAASGSSSRRVTANWIRG
jgi:hypothetical protein